MVSKKLFIILITLLYTCSFFANSQIILSENNAMQTTNVDFAELPTWNIGNSWKYTMDFDFIVRDGSSITFSVNAVIENMYAVLTSIENVGGDETYILTLDGEIHGKISLFNAQIDIADFNGDFWGDAYIGKNTLGIKKFEFEVDGQVSIPILGWRHMYFNMNMGFDECFDFFDFPINVNEPSWDVHIDEASLSAEVDIDIPFGETSFDGSMMFNDVMSVKGTETVGVPAGTYDTILIGGTWGHLSNLWYAPDVGYLVKLDEALNWENGKIESIFHLNLLETNYDISNDPPLPPDQPYGDQDGEVETEYYYDSKGIDPNDGQISYLFDWGDGEDSDWLGPYASGTSVSASHIWYSKGNYNVKVKSKDSSEIESDWSEPLSVLIKGYPNVKVTVHQIDQIDEIDIGSDPELYYTVSAISEGISSPPQTFCNTNDGTYEGVWVESSFWEPDEEHTFKGYSKDVTINLKLMDQDDRWDDPVYAADDLADVSGCAGGGVDNDIFPPAAKLRGATYYGTYDVVEKELKPYGTGAAGENADYVYKQNGYYITSGEHQPDSSNSEDHNDAEIWFELYSDYRPPRAEAILLNQNGKIRPNQRLNFNGVSQYGVPDYSWSWDFGNGETSSEQNPMHVYTTSGTYSVKLTVTDGFGQKNTDTIELNIENNNPILSKDKVEWTGNGGTDDTFTFSVHYIDSDGDNSLIKNVVIDDNPYLLDGFGSNTDFTLSFLGSQLGKGNHRYYFHFEDGYGGSVITTEKTFEVSKAKAVSKQYPFLLRQIISHFPIFEKFRLKYLEEIVW